MEVRGRLTQPSVVPDHSRLVVHDSFLILMVQVIIVAVDAYRVLVVTAVRGVPMDMAAQGIAEEVQDIVQGVVILGWVALVQVGNSNLLQYKQ